MWQRICVATIMGGLVLWFWGSHVPEDRALAAPLAPAPFGTGGLITHVQELEGKLLRIVVVDPNHRVMGVYDLGRENGEIKLRSIRNLNADLQMNQYNSEEPSPADIKKMLDQQ